VQPVDPLTRLARALAALERERPRDDADGQRADLVLGDLRDDRRGARAGAAALAGRDEHHVRALQRLLDLVTALVGRAVPGVRIRAGSESARELRADLQLDVGVAHLQRLRIGVDRDELDALQAGVDHPVDGVRAASAYPDDLDYRQVAAGIHRSQFSLARWPCFSSPSGLSFRPTLKRHLSVPLSDRTPELPHLTRFCAVVSTHGTISCVVRGGKRLDHGLRYGELSTLG